MELADGQRSFGKGADVFKGGGIEVVLRPERGGTSNGVEPFEVVESRTGFVVIAADDGARSGWRASPGCDGVGVGSRSHNQIAAAEDAVVVTFGVFEDGV